MSAQRFTRASLPDSLADTTTWPAADVSILQPDQLERFENLQNAVMAYLAGETGAKIQALWDCSAEEVLRALNRCVTITDGGEIAGWWGLFKGLRLAKFRRVSAIRRQPPLAKGGYAGALQTFFDDHPDVQQVIDKFILTGKGFGAVRHSRPSKKRTHELFLSQVREKGLSTQEWPLCTETHGRRTIDRYFDDLTKRNYEKAVRLTYGVQAASKARTGRGYRSRVVPRGPLDVVELDEHTTDTIVTVSLNTPKGPKEVPIPRITLIGMVDRYTNYILGYHLVLRSQVDKGDVMTCLDNYVRGQTMPVDELMDEGIWLGDREGLAWGLTTLHVDNLLAHWAKELSVRVREDLGATVSFGGLARPERRRWIEAIFNRLRERVFQRLPSTTGSHPRDSLRQDPVARAVKYGVSYEMLVRELDAAVREHNTTGTTANYGDSPLQQLIDHFRPGKSAAIPPLLPPLRPGQASLRMSVHSATVRGNRATGARPRVSFMGATYTSPELASRWDLLGHRLRLHADPDDVSTLKAFTDTGRPIGELQATAGMGFPHSLQMRKLLRAKISSGFTQGAQAAARGILEKSQHDALASNRTRPRVSAAARVVAEERTKGHTAESMGQHERLRRTPDSRQAASQIRQVVKIDFGAIN